MTAECAFCTTAIPIKSGTSFGAGLFSSTYEQPNQPLASGDGFS